ncbi:MAG: ATP-grasp domain-containing protein [Candidatus Desulfofervidus auxilii]|nr:ATP-grasp domain-containing protein [Candidatus Desulfofervidus auxilii]
MEKFRILIDGSGTATALSIIKGINKQKKYSVFIVTIDMDSFNTGRFLSDKFYQVPPADSPLFIKELFNICKTESIDLFLPVIDLSFLKLAQAKKQFRIMGTHILLAPSKAIEITSDKFKTYTFFKKHNIPTPMTFLPDSLPNKLEFPLFIKPRIGGRASINAFKVESHIDLEYYMSKIKHPLVQEYIDGFEFTADCLNSLDGKSFIECIVRKRIETKGGLAIKSEIIKPPLSEKIKHYIRKISITLRLPGAYNIQGFIKKNEEIFFTEINPRFAGTHAFTIEAGLNSIEYILDMFCGIPIEQIKRSIAINYDLKMVRYWQEIFVNGNKAYTPWTF